MSAIVVSLCLVGLCYGEDITIRVIDVKNGDAIKNWTVDINPVDPTSGKVISPTFMITTGSDGKGLFHLPTDISPKIFIVASLIGDVDQCSGGEYRVQDILQHGVIGGVVWRDRPCDPNAQATRNTFAPHPGEVVVFVRFLGFWERLLRR